MLSIILSLAIHPTLAAVHSLDQHVDRRVDDGFPYDNAVEVV